jgi:hypothetical protein
MMHALYRREYQDSWTLKYPWCLQDPSGTRTIDKFKCITCNRVNGHDLFPNAKGNNLRKHEGWMTEKCYKPKLGKKKRDS